MIAAAIALAALIQSVAPAPQTLNGAWNVDLSSDPAEPYIKPMNLALTPDGVVTGDFYDSAIEAGRWRNRTDDCASPSEPRTASVRITRPPA